MLGIETRQAKNAEAAIRGILIRAEHRGVRLSKSEVLEELKWDDDEDTTVWGATVDRLMGVQA